MSRAHAEILRCHTSPLAPLATGVTPVLGVVEGIRAVLFDVYGTLFVSASGDIDATPAGRVEAVRAAFAALGLDGSARAGVDAMLEAVRAEHERCREAGVDHPEVDIVEIWQRAVDALGVDVTATGASADFDFERLAIEYEVRANPVWPMPGLDGTLRAIVASGRRLGIISNAQFYTKYLFDALAGASPAALGFDADLTIYSYRLRRAKPSVSLYEHARRALAQYDIAAHETLYVGNDMLNDILPASRVGFRTVLFAGDDRSYRPRTSDDRVSGVTPDRIVTSLQEVLTCLGIATQS